MSTKQHILITGGAGFIGAYLTAVLLREGYRITVVDDLLFGGESLLSHFSNPNFHFVKADVLKFLESILVCDKKKLKKKIFYLAIFYINLIEVEYLFLF